LIGAEGQPAVPAAINVQQLAKTGARLAADEVPAARALPLHQPGGLQGPAYHRVGPPAARVAPHARVEVAHVEAAVALPIQPQPALHLRLRNAVRRTIHAPQILKTADTVLLVAHSP